MTTWHPFNNFTPVDVLIRIIDVKGQVCTGFWSGSSLSTNFVLKGPFVKWSEIKQPGPPPSETCSNCKYVDSRYQENGSYDHYCGFKPPKSLCIEINLNQWVWDTDSCSLWKLANTESE